MKTILNTLSRHKLVRYSVIAYLVYLGLALLVITPLLNILPHKYLRDNYGRELTTQFVWFNPFTLSLEVRQALLPENSAGPAGQSPEPFVALAAASINVSVASIWQQGIVFDRLRLHELEAHIQRFPEGVFNFSDFIPESSDEKNPDADASGGLIGLTVNDVDLQAAVIKVTDHDRQQPFSTQWQDLKIHAVDFSTVLREGKPYKIALSDEAGGTLTWEGTVSIAQGHSEGSLALAGIRLAPFWRFAEPWVAFQLREGHFNAAANYEVNWNEALTYTVDNGSASIESLAIIPKNEAALPDTSVSLEALLLQGLAVQSTGQEAVVEQIVVDGLAVDGYSEGAVASLQTLFAVDFPAQAAQTPEVEPTPTNWQARLNQFELKNSQVRWRSEFTEPSLTEVTQLRAQINDVLWPLAGQTQAELGLSLNSTAQLNTKGTIDLGAGNGEFSYQVGSVQLPWFNPALPPAFRAQLTSGEANAQGQITLTAFAPEKVQLTAAINQFGMRQNEAEQQFTGWNALQLNGLALDFPQQSIVLQKLTLDALQGRIHIAKDGALNTSNLWVEESPQDAEAVEATEEAGWQIAIPTIALKNAAIDFQDDSLPIEFRTLIGNLNGFIEGLNSQGDTAASVDIKGSVDGYAPVALAGTLNPLQSPPMLDLKLAFDGVDLARVTPYSGTYAGYAIDRGLLDLDLAYTLKDNKLQGKNNVVIDQLKLGENVNSDKAIDIPLKLGISLLTNANGVIDMKIPVSGALDDPSFKLSSVIASAFINLITKAVTAPFSLLANLVSSDEDLQYIPFAPGAAELPAASESTLLTLTEALNQRPGLTLAIVGRVHPSEDRSALQTQALDAALLAQGLTQASIDERDEAWSAAIAKLSTAPEAAEEPLSMQAMLNQALTGFAIDDTALLQLAEARATAVKSFLLNRAALDPARAVIEKAALEDQSRDFNGAELLIEN